MFVELILIFGVVLIYAFYKWATINESYFAERKLKAVPSKSLIGNTGALSIKLRRPDHWLDSIYNKYPNEKVIGIFDYRQPVYFVRDLDFIKQLTIRDFEHFEDHELVVNSSTDSFLGNSLVFLNGKKWRDMRATLSPVFTGSKMRSMFELIIDCANDTIKHLKNESKTGKPIREEMTEFFSHYTTDVITSCAFGLKTNSYDNPSNQFFSFAKTIKSATTMLAAIILLVFRSFPKLIARLGIELFPPKIKEFFRSIVLDAMKMREEQKINRPDMINLLMQVRQGNLKHSENDESSNDAGIATIEESTIGRQQVKRKWNDNEIIGQCLLFFAAGFDTTSVALSFTMYELAVNQDIQQTLYEEIYETSADLNGKQLTYDILTKLKYLDQTLCECLRKWPPSLVTNRLCTKDYTCELDESRRFLIEKGRSIIIPIYSIHRDAQYYSDPEKFDPNRFSDANKHSIPAGAFIPFGVGPRNCIGSRFALMEVKALLFYILLNFNIQPYEETQIPLQLAKAPLTLLAEKGIHLEFKPRFS